MLKRAKPVPGKYAPGSSVLKHCMLSLDRMVSCMDVSSPVSHFQSLIQPSRRGLTYVILKQLHIHACTYIYTHTYITSLLYLLKKIHQQIETSTWLTRPSALKGTPPTVRLSSCMPFLSVNKSPFTAIFMTASLSILITRLRPCSSTEIWNKNFTFREPLKSKQGQGSQSTTILQRKIPNLSPLAVIDFGSTAGHPADCAVLKLQLQLPMVHCQHNPRTVLVTTSKEDHTLRIVGSKVKFCWKAVIEKEWKQTMNVCVLRSNAHYPMGIVSLGVLSHLCLLDFTVWSTPKWQVWAQSLNQTAKHWLDKREVVSVQTEPWFSLCLVWKHYF